MVFGNQPYALSAVQNERTAASFEFLKEFSVNKVIYGINTGFGPMAQYKISDADLSKLQYNLIRSHSNGTGNRLSDQRVRAVMLCRLQSLTLGFSGISPDVAKQLELYIAKEVYPVIFENGSVGASGDLVQLAHLGLGLIGEGNCTYKGELRPTAEVLKELNIAPMKLSLRDGLAIINGTSCMTGIAAINVIQAQRLLEWELAASCLINELIGSFDDFFSLELNNAKLHEGQREVAKMMRTNLEDSQLIHKREHWFFDGAEEGTKEVFKKKLQEYYSIRCVPQILGPIYEAINAAAEVVEKEFNSANDNPIVDVASRSVHHGGNFHGDYIAYEMDKLKIGVAKLSMLIERQLNFLVNPKLNDIFPPFLNRQTLGLNFGVQGMQFTAVSTTAENQTLSNPMSVHSIPNNNDNQDIVSMGTNSALMAGRVIDNGFRVLAIHLIAAAQAVDISGEHDKLSSRSKAIYKAVRAISIPITDDVPRFNDISQLTNYLQNHNL